MSTKSPATHSVLQEATGFAEHVMLSPHAELMLEGFTPEQLSMVQAMISTAYEMGAQRAFLNHVAHTKTPEQQ